MESINDFADFRLSNFLSKETIEEREFNYAGIDGIAEVIGWHVVFFRDLENPGCTSVISIEDANYNQGLCEFVDFLLAELNIKLNVGDNFEKIMSKFGQPFSYDEIIEGMKRYNYLLNENSIFIRFGVDSNDGLILIEIINNKKVLKERWMGLPWE